MPSEVIRVTNPLRFEDGAEMSDSREHQERPTSRGDDQRWRHVRRRRRRHERHQCDRRRHGLDDLPAKAAYQMPSLVQPRSRCGGPIVLIVDESQSLGAAGVAAVRQGVVDFIECSRRDAGPAHGCSVQRAWLPRR